ncbi:UNVERIFIED_CONTAM: hypothetical protein GTU68_055822 [Idotea baltica]|nr:hypothetical protein [Idotea baltica]
MTETGENVLWRKIGAALLLIGIALGAFGAHLLPKKLGADFNSEVWDTAVFYHLIHALALFFLALRGAKVGKFVKIVFLVGILCFSGSLYGLAVDNSLKFLGPVTPLGGLLFMIGWASLVYKKSL